MNIFRALTYRRYAEQCITDGRERTDDLIMLVMQRFHCDRASAIGPVKQAKQALIYGPRHYKANRDKAIVDAQNKRCGQLGVPGFIQLEDWLALCQRHGNQCVICGQSLPLTIDHIKPISKGGTNFIENIQPACKPCNSRKHNHYEET